MACGGAGSGTEICGGRSRLSVYTNTALSDTKPSPMKQVVAGYAYQGCYTDPSAALRALRGYSTSASPSGGSGTGMTQELCVSTCSGRGYKLAGVEYGRECYCGNEIMMNNLQGGGGGGGKAAVGVQQTADGECNMPCAGDRDEVCGGSSRIGVWMLAT